ncbi:MAG: amidohydrolase family protein [Clostridiales Family XIII bacterium]|jgi:N-acyl-D-amino-acid deacylase|nr:amidohydrolase family protein [Clostridiales Family XIII bacterium]
MYETVIKNGIIMDPKRRLKTVGNIGIQNGLLAAVTREEISGNTVIDAANRIVCPGFVDIHSHLNYPHSAAWLSVCQGITTCLTGNCGMNAESSIDKFLNNIEERGYPLNIATLIGHSFMLRSQVGIDDPYATATPEQRGEMVKLAEQALEEGALGVSLGLEYAPGTDEEEFLSLARVAAKYDKLVTIHTRAGAFDFATGLDEAIQIAEKTGARVQISHLAYQFGVHKDVMPMALVMIENAIGRGLPILCDSGVYAAFATFIQSSVFDPGWEKQYDVALDHLMVSSGKYIGQRATQEMIDEIRATETDTVGTAFVGVFPDLIRALQTPFTMIATDAGLVEKEGEGHPQDSGTFPSVFGDLVREQGALSLMDAVYKSTYMPALQMGIADRKGWIGEGADADLVIFDPATIQSKSDYVGIGKPDALPVGIEYVFVNGVAVVEDSVAKKDRLPGKTLREKNKPWRL